MTTPFSSDQVGWRRATINSLVGASASASASARGAMQYCSARSASGAMLYLHPVNIMPPAWNGGIHCGV